MSSDSKSGLFSGDCVAAGITNCTKKLDNFILLFILTN